MLRNHNQQANSLLRVDSSQFTRNKELITMRNKNKIKAFLKNELKVHGHLIGVAAGSGMTAKYAEQGGADFILALNSGRFRQMGVSSLAGFLPYANSKVHCLKIKWGFPLRTTLLIFDYNGRLKFYNRKIYH
jgi:hypothetical protein